MLTVKVCTSMLRRALWVEVKRRMKVLAVGYTVSQTFPGDDILARPILRCGNIFQIATPR